MRPAPRGGARRSDGGAARGQGGGGDGGGLGDRAGDGAPLRGRGGRRRRERRRPCGREARRGRDRGGGGTRPAPGDVTRTETADALADAALDAFGRLDVFHNNAGGAMPTPIEATDDARWRRDLALNLDAVWFGTRAALRAMVPRRSGCILTTSSGAGLGAVHGLSAYGAAKAAVVQLMRSVALESGPLGIRANTICPGSMDTPQMRAWLDA